MDKLCNLIKFHTELINLIDHLSISSVINEKQTLVNGLISNNADVSMSNNLSEIDNLYQAIDENNQTIIRICQEIIKNIDVQIENIKEQFIKNSTQVSQEQLDVLFTTPPKQELIPNSILSKIYTSSHLSWAGLIFGRVSANYINYLVASDPLYICTPFNDKLYLENPPNSGCDPHYIQQVICVYPEQYQRRLRLYNNLQLLPNNQLSVILIWDFFNYITYNQILDYLKQMLLLLRPGGSIIFSYNNFDIYGTAKYGDDRYFASGKKLQKDCEELGFIVNIFSDVLPDDYYQSELKENDPLKETSTVVSWAKISKSGTLSTVKLTQAAGLISRK